MIGLLLITHGRLGEELLATAQGVVGGQRAVAAVSLLAHEGIPQLHQKISEALAALTREGGDDGTLVFTDLVGGTPCNVVLPLVQGRAMEVVAGVNLYMVISTLTHRGRLPLGALVVKILADGRRSVMDVKEAFLSKLR